MTSTSPPNQVIYSPPPNRRNGTASQTWKHKQISTPPQKFAPSWKSINPRQYFITHSNSLGSTEPTPTHRSMKSTQSELRLDHSTTLHSLTTNQLRSVYSQGTNAPMAPPSLEIGPSNTKNPRDSRATSNSPTTPAGSAKPPVKNSVAFFGQSRQLVNTLLALTTIVPPTPPKLNSTLSGAFAANRERRPF